MEICILIQAALLVLAILSRMHFSKYKKYRDCRQQIRCALLILFVSTLFAQFHIWNGRQETESEQLIFERSDYDGGTKTEEIRLSIDDKEYFFSMEIEPREYTEEEFYSLAQEQGESLKTGILKDNPDFEHVSSSLNLPQEDDAGVFSYSWRSDNPEVVSSYGEVHTEGLTQPVSVTLILTVSYRTYESEIRFPMEVYKEDSREDVIDRTKEELRRLEQQTRTDNTVALPTQWGDVTIRTRKSDTGQAEKYMLAGCLLAGLTVFCMQRKKKEAEKLQNDALSRQYPSFVNRLWLLLGAGMTVQMGIRQILAELKNETKLKRELEYAVHRLDTGSEESWVYEQLGRELKLPEYEQLFVHVSQHIRMGTKDLRDLMELEMQTALKKRREYAKKQGEEASTKLLFPMVLLLALVMGMILYPAMSGF